MNRREFTPARAGRSGGPARPKALGRLRRTRLPLIAVLGLALFATAATGANAQQFAGVNTHVLDTYGDGWSQLRIQYAAMLLQNVPATQPKVVRIDLRWNQLEPQGAGNYDAGYVSQIDNVVSWAQGWGMKPLFVVLGTPCWASSAPTAVTQGCANTSAGDAYPPTKPRRYADAMRYLAQRYGSRVAGWELWNEPNLSYFWNSANPAADYVKLVGAAYPAIKSVSTVPVVAGALSLSDYDFTGRLYADGIKGKLDVLSIHPYSFQCSPLALGSDPCLSPYGTEASFSDGPPAVRSVMLQYGDRSPLWLTEVGWNTSTAASGVGLSTQATYVDQAYRQVPNWSSAVGSAVNVQGVFSYELQDEGTDPGNAEENYGLLYVNGGQKPAASVFEQDAALLK